MDEAKKTLLEEPFSLEEEDAELLARYLIEDSNEDHIYRDDLNENHRGVVKSIIWNLVKDYPVISTDSQEEEECASLITKYGDNLRQTLQTMHPSGVVSKQKLMEAMVGIGIDASNEVMDLFVGKAALHSRNLLTLQYLQVLNS